MRFRKPRYSKS